MSKSIFVVEKSGWWVGEEETKESGTGTWKICSSTHPGLRISDTVEVGGEKINKSF